jgi:hypothetical protein
MSEPDYIRLGVWAIAARGDAAHDSAIDQPIRISSAFAVPTAVLRRVQIQAISFQFGPILAAAGRYQRRGSTRGHHAMQRQCIRRLRGARAAGRCGVGWSCRSHRAAGRFFLGARKRDLSPINVLRRFAFPPRRSSSSDTIYGSDRRTGLYQAGLVISAIM